MNSSSWLGMYVMRPWPDKERESNLVLEKEAFFYLLI
jgi:hypothetical protein